MDYKILFKLMAAMKFNTTWSNHLEQYIFDKSLNSVEDVEAALREYTPA